MARFKPVSSQVDFPALERELLDYWYREGIIEKYLKKNQKSDKKFSFLDGPITANNPMGVHHGWGRTYKDLWQRFYNMKGFKQRFQNGFDEQGLWVEVEVEKELGLKSKKDIENLVPGDKFKSLEKFINLCKERVKKYAAIQTEQSKRLGYFMDWDNSYHTSSDENNYAIWNYIKTVWEKGWFYKGHDSVPWCPRCGTAISQHEISTEEYGEVTHESIYFKLPIEGRDKEYLLVWTTTPWTLPANITVAVDKKLDYSLVEVEGEKFWVAKELVSKIFKKDHKIIKDVKGKELVGLKYSWAFDDLPKVNEVAEKYGDKFHVVIATDDLIMPITTEEGTGLVHTAVSAGTEDFQLGKKMGLPMIEVIDEEAAYLPGLGEFSGKNAKKDPKIILDYLQKQEERWVFEISPYKHRYPACWRCKTELVWRVVDEWYIAMDIADDSKKTYREQMMEVAKDISWYPKWGLDRELDWLKNMHDWLISKKRYWGLALPIWECQKCGNFEVIGSKQELKEKAVEDWKEFEGHTPHRPWIDDIKIKCSKCNEIISRVPDVGNPWLDAGIVPFSTLPKEWFPADLVNEQFIGQFKNWFYALIAMSTALKRTTPFKDLFGYGTVLDEKGEPMHKSKGNAIEFNEAADKVGVDVMRWLYLRTNPEHNVYFGFHVLDEIKRLFLLKLWNVYSFFVMYANSNNWEPNQEEPKPKHYLDWWVLSRMSGSIKDITKSLEEYNPSNAMGLIEIFVYYLSNWYVRRIRDRVSSENEDLDDKKRALETLHFVLKEYMKAMAPFVPFITEEIYRNLTNEVSVHLCDWPRVKILYDKYYKEELEKGMEDVWAISEQGHARRKEANIRLRQPLASLTYAAEERLDKQLEQILAEELNVKSVEYRKSSSKGTKVDLDTNLTHELQAEGRARDLIREIQQLRKEQNLTLADRTKIIAPNWPKDFEKQILSATASISIEKGETLSIIKVKD